MVNFIQLMHEGIEKELPSGLVVRLRPVDAGQMLNSNRIPENLMKVVQDSIRGVKEGKDEAETKAAIQEGLEESAKENLKDFNDTVNFYQSIRKYGEAVALHSFIHPKIVDDPQNENEIRLDWLPTDDCIALASWVGVPLSKLESFRFQTLADVEPVQSGETNLPDTEQGVRDESVSEEPVFEGESTVGDTSDHPSSHSVPV